MHVLQHVQEMGFVQHLGLAHVPPASRARRANLARQVSLDRPVRHAQVAAKIVTKVSRDLGGVVHWRSRMILQPVIASTENVRPLALVPATRDGQGQTTEPSAVNVLTVSS